MSKLTKYTLRKTNFFKNEYTSAEYQPFMVTFTNLAIKSNHKKNWIQQTGEKKKINEIKIQKIASKNWLKTKVQMLLS